MLYVTTRTLVAAAAFCAIFVAHARAPSSVVGAVSRFARNHSLLFTMLLYRVGDLSLSHALLFE
jgi:hypothetical protein